MSESGSLRVWQLLIAVARVRRQVLHVLRIGGRVLVPIKLGRAVADAIPGARFVAVSGQDSMAWLGDADAVVGEIEAFLTGSRTPGLGSQLATIMFTDIVGSTELAAHLHHERWQRLLGEHDQLVRREIELTGGVPIKAVEMLPNDVRGIAVHIAARICELASAGQVLVSGTVTFSAGRLG
jgi:class 3 adenylate cyclase